MLIIGRKGRFSFGTPQFGCYLCAGPRKSITGATSLSRIARNSREIELMTWAENAVILRGRAHYGRMDEVAEYVFHFNRTSEGKLLKFGAIAFSKSEDGALARQVIDTFVAKN